MLSEQQTQHFNLFGYVVLPKVVSNEQILQLRQVTEEEMRDRRHPLEFYSGLNEKKIRLLLNIYERHEIYKNWAKSAVITESIKALLEAKRLYFSLAHNNCVKTKRPLSNSRTDWHRDTYFWDFSNKHLINAWLPLGDENADNGGMSILPGSHHWDIAADILDEKKFMMKKHPSNAARLALAKQVNLKVGDCLLFSAHCFHMTSANRTNERKLSVVFTYHDQSTQNLSDPTSSRIVY